MKDFNIPMELEKELERLSKRDKFYTWVLVTLVAIAFMLGLRFYLQTNQAVITNQSQVQNGIPLANNSGIQPAGQGGCGGDGATGGCGSNGGGCGSGQAAKVSNPQLEAQALELFKAAKGNINGVRAIVTDYGCHKQVDIVDKDNNLLQSYQYRGGQLTVAAQ